MMKMAAQVTAAGFAGLIALKVAALFVFPIVGLVLGVVGLFLKIAFVMALGYFVLKLLRRDRVEEEIEVEVEDIEEVD